MITPCLMARANFICFGSEFTTPMSEFTFRCRLAKEERKIRRKVVVGGSSDCWKAMPMWSFFMPIDMDWEDDKPLSISLFKSIFKRATFASHHFQFSKKGNEIHLGRVHTDAFECWKRKPGMMTRDEAVLWLDSFDEEEEELIVGSQAVVSGISNAQAAQRRVANRQVQIPRTNYNQVARNAATMVTQGAMELTPPVPSGMSRFGKQPRQVDFSANHATAKKRRIMTKASASASARILLGSDAMQGDTYAENLAMALEEFGEDAVTTHINPSSKQYRRLVEALKVPLQYVPKIAGHDAAGTCRRAFMEKMRDTVGCGMVGMISPSQQEWHMNPLGAGHYHNADGGVDPARINRPCNMCQKKRCAVLQTAIEDNRVSYGSLRNAANLFKYMEVDYLWLVNIEPNIKPVDILEVMVVAGIENGFSVATIDWRVLEGRKTFCPVIEQETTLALDKVVSKFSGGGSYVQPLGNVKALFAPTFARGCALRRTILGKAGVALLMELQVDHGGFGTSFVPDQVYYYLIPVPHPNEGQMYVKVERKGLDRVLHTFRTTVSRTVESARIQLRQANVTYSVSGTQLTPRLELSASEAELLAIWMVSYSAVMDTIAEVAVEDMKITERVVLKRGTLQQVSESLIGVVTSRLMANAAESNPQFGSQSSVRRWLRTCEQDGRFLTLDQISDKAYEAVYGKAFILSSSLNAINYAWGKFVQLLRAPKEFMGKLREVSSTTWKHGFTCVDILAQSLLLCAGVTHESTGFLLDVTVHLCRSLGVDPWPVRSVINYIDTVRNPGGKIWADVLAAQNLPFQAASIKIVESLVNNFSPDPEVLEFAQREAQLGALLTAETQEAARRRAEMNQHQQTMDDIPFNRFLTEMKIFLGKVNTRAGRITQLSSILNAAREESRKLSPEARINLEKLREQSSGLLSELPPTGESLAPTTSMFCTSLRAPAPSPLPIAPVDFVGEDGSSGQIAIEEAFKSYLTVDVDANLPTVPDNHRVIKRLKALGNGLDFSPIHGEMEANMPGFTEATRHPEMLPRIPIGAVSQYSPDSKGGIFLENIARRALKQVEEEMPTVARQQFASDEQVRTWVATRSAETTIAPVGNAIRQSAPRLGNNLVPYVMHIEGLAMGGKSKGIRSWISDQDCVVVPSNKLKEEWIENLGELDPLQRATVYTQHTALTKNCARFLIVDEAYTFETPHLELLRRFPSARGLITIGDGHQIRDVFAEETATHNPAVHRPLFTGIAPVSFVPFDVLYTYLRANTSEIRCGTYYSGSPIARGLSYVVEGDEIVTPSKKDLCINGTQNGKAYMIARGVDTAITAHESQGSRSEFSFIHGIESFGVCPDLAFLGLNLRHFGVAITRARKNTVFVLKDKATARQVPTCDAARINGTKLPNDYLYAGTAYDLVDPVALSDIVYERCSDEVLRLEDADLETSDTQITLGSLIDEESCEAIPLEAFRNTIVPADSAAVLHTKEARHPSEVTESFVFNPAAVVGSGLMNMTERRTSPTTVTPLHFSKARHIVRIMFDRVLDVHMFTKLLSYEKSSIEQQTRDQVLKMAMATQTTRSDTISFAFPKNEAAKKVMVIGKGLKTLSVTAMNQTQLAMFGDVCNVLTHTFARSLKPGIMSPVGFTRDDVAKKLGSLGVTFEIDLEKQDSTHTATHVAVFVLLVEMVATRLGMAELVQEIRQCRTIGDMGSVMRIVMGTGLGSGDAWTLIANKVMAFSVLICRYHIPACVQMLQVGDDITVDRKLRLRERPLAGSEGVLEKKIFNTSAQGRPHFTSYTSVNEDYSIAARVRGIVKMATQPRTRTQHISYGVEGKMIAGNIAVIGLPAYAEAHSELFNSSPEFVERIVQRAIYLSRMDFDSIPEHLRLHAADEKRCIVHSRSWGCFGFALSHAVGGNVAALNALAAYSRPVTLAESISACMSNGVEFVNMREKWVDNKKKSMDKVVDLYLARKKTSAVVYLFTDHCVSVTSISSETINLGGVTRYKVNLISEEVEEIWL